jgi:hypothetical protein
MIRHAPNKILMMTMSLLTLIALSGCGSMPFPAEGWPAQMVYLIEHAGELANDPNDFAREPTIDTSIDDLADLDGCWAAFVQLPTTVEDQTWDLYQFLNYDAESDALTRSTIERLWMGFVIVSVTIERGSLSFTDDGRIIFDVKRIEANMPNGDIRDITNKYDEPPRYEMLATFENDGSLRAAFLTLGGTNEDFLDNHELVHHGVDCPE